MTRCCASPADALIAETDRASSPPDHRFKTRAEMAVLFADIPEALASTVEIAERCAFRPMTRKPILPRFTVGAGAIADAAATRPPNCAARPRRGWPTASRSTACRRARPRRTIASGWPSSSTSSPG